MTASGKSKTFTTKEKARACEEFGAVNLTYVETVHENGLVEVHVFGISDGESYERRTTRLAALPVPINLDMVAEARRHAGWAEVVK